MHAVSIIKLSKKVGVHEQSNNWGVAYKTKNVFTFLTRARDMKAVSPLQYLTVLYWTGHSDLIFSKMTHSPPHVSVCRGQSKWYQRKKKVEKPMHICIEI